MRRLASDRADASWREGCAATWMLQRSVRSSFAAALAVCRSRLVDAKLQAASDHLPRARVRPSRRRRARRRMSARPREPPPARVRVAELLSVSGDVPLADCRWRLVDDAGGWLLLAVEDRLALPPTLPPRAAGRGLAVEVCGRSLRSLFAAAVCGRCSELGRIAGRIPTGKRERQEELKSWGCY